MAKVKYRKICEFIIPGKPVGKQRPRAGKNKNLYTPRKTVSFENLVSFLASEQMRKFKKRCLPDQPIRASVVSFRTRPKSMPKKERFRRYCTRKPDVDNIEKIVFDACRSIVFNDDAQIAETHGAKFWGDEDFTKVAFYQIVETPEEDES